jgi:hypothetical protein
MYTHDTIILIVLQLAYMKWPIHSKKMCYYKIDDRNL